MANSFALSKRSEIPEVVVLGTLDPPGFSTIFRRSAVLIVWAGTRQAIDSVKLKTFSSTVAEDNLSGLKPHRRL